jgi:hypothetical protein
MPQTSRGTSTIETKTNTFIERPIISLTSCVRCVRRLFLKQRSLLGLQKSITSNRRADDFDQVYFARPLEGAKRRKGKRG